MPEGRPKVSIIMNCLNAERYLPAALASVRAQTFTDYEIIFLDNASKDASPDIAHEFGPELRYFRNGETVPLGKARNQAIAQARGDYIAFLDCDDLWKPPKLARQVELLDSRPAVGLVCTDTEISDAKRGIRRLFSQTEPGRGMVFDDLMRRQWISMSSAMLRKAALDSIAENGLWFDEDLNLCEEADVFYRIAHDFECDYIDEPLTVWRVHGANTTFRKFGRFADETLAILAKHRRLYPGYDRDHAETISLVASRAAFQRAVALWRDGENRQARQIIAGHCGKGPKYRLFWWATWLPGSMFDTVARIYFSLPAWMRK